MNATGNSFGNSASSFGGGFPVWRSVDINGKWQAGGVIANLPPVGSVIPAGSPVEINTETHTAKVLNFFKVNAAIDGAATSLQVKVLDGLPRLKAGNFIGVPAATATGTMTAITVGAVTQGETYDTITIVANSLGALAADALLVEAVATGAGVLPYAVPNALTFADVYLKAGDTAATCAGVHTGTVYAKRTPFMSTGVKANLSGIKFDNAF